MAAVISMVNDPFTSLESKGLSSLSREEERDHFRQRFLSMKLVIKEMQQQLVTFKTRCAGVDTIAIMLKESKQEVLKITREKKALETAIANLQNRLSTNGLSSSVNIEETELFIPGASKQTLDNLARENARLRNLLKSTEGQSGKKPLEDLQSMKALVERFENENNLLKEQLQELEIRQEKLNKQHEEAIKKIQDEYKVETQEVGLEPVHHKQRKSSNSKNKEVALDVVRESKECQTMELQPSKIEQIRRTLRELSEHCVQLDVSLENAQIASRHDEKSNNERSLKSVEESLELQKKLHQVVQMNQHWQMYNASQVQEIKNLVARIGQLEGLAQENDRLKKTIENIDAENKTLKRLVETLKQDANQRQLKPQFDMSIVEILKQQIQVCTEDFNTERKDREQAVRRAKQLQEDIKKLSNENDALKNEVDTLKKIRNIPEQLLERSDATSWNVTQTPASQFKSRGEPFPHQLPSHKIPFGSYVSPSPGVSSASLSPRASPSSKMMTSVSPLMYTPFSEENVGGSSVGSHHNSQKNLSNFSFMSLPRSGRNSLLEGQTSGTGSNLKNFPANSSESLMSRQTNKPKNGNEQYLICPKCSKEFSDSELLRHIEMCPD